MATTSLYRGTSIHRSSTERPAGSRRARHRPTARPRSMESLYPGSPPGARPRRRAMPASPDRCSRWRGHSPGGTCRGRHRTGSQPGPARLQSRGGDDGVSVAAATATAVVALAKALCDVLTVTIRTASTPRTISVARAVATAHRTQTFSKLGRDPCEPTAHVSGPNPRVVDANQQEPPRRPTGMLVLVRSDRTWVYLGTSHPLPGRR